MTRSSTSRGSAEAARVREGRRARAWLRKARGVLLAFVSLLVVRCYRPDREDCVLTCAPDGDCPYDMVCSRGRCVHDGGSCPQASCEAFALSCGSGERVLLCAADGAGRLEQSTCRDPTPSCVNGACAACTPGTAVCSGPASQTLCDSDATWRAASNACSAQRPRCILGSCEPTRVLALGAAHACATGHDGLLRCWGENADGQLGLGDRQNRGTGPTVEPLAPVALLEAKPTLRAAAGGAHTCAILADGSVHCWGRNTHGQLGLGDRENRGDASQSASTRVDLGGEAALALALGQRHSCALLARGRIKCWGDNEFGQLGLGDSEARGDEPGEMGTALPEVDLGEGAGAVQIAAGGYFTCALLGDRRIKCWGQNGTHQLGLPEAALDDASSRGDEPGEMGTALKPVDLGGVRALSLSAGFAHSCAVLEGGRVRCWGDTREPDGPLQPALAVAAGVGHDCALFTDLRVRCWGVDHYGELGIGGTALRHPEQAEAVDLGTTLEGALLASDVQVGVDFGCALLRNDQVKCWGQNESGQLAVFSTDPIGDEPDEMGDRLPSVPLD